MPVGGDGIGQGRLWPLKATALGGRKEVDGGSRRNWEKPGPGLGLGHPRHTRVRSPDLSTEVYPHLDSYLPYLAGWRDGPSRRRGTRGEGASRSLHLWPPPGPHPQVLNLNALAC